MEYCLAMKRNKLVLNQQCGEFQNNHAEGKNPEKKKYLLCDPMYIKF